MGNMKTEKEVLLIPIFNEFVHFVLLGNQGIIFKKKWKENWYNCVS